MATIDIFEIPPEHYCVYGHHRDRLECPGCGTTVIERHPRVKTKLKKDKHGKDHQFAHKHGNDDICPVCATVIEEFKLSVEERKAHAKWQPRMPDQTIGNVSHIDEYGNLRS
jgi:ribosomal protein S27E